MWPFQRFSVFISRRRKIWRKNDEEIINLYWNKSENAIFETEKKYRKYCEYIAYNILQDKEDTKECINES